MPRLTSTSPAPRSTLATGAPKERESGRAAWRRGAAERGPRRAAGYGVILVESGLRNLRGQSFDGFFGGMHESLNTGETRHTPQAELQVKWFIETASTVCQRRVAETKPDPAKGPDGAGGVDR